MSSLKKPTAHITVLRTQTKQLALAMSLIGITPLATSFTHTQAPTIEIAYWYPSGNPQIKRGSATAACLAQPAAVNGRDAFRFAYMQEDRTCMFYYNAFPSSPNSKWSLMQLGNASAHEESRCNSSHTLIGNQCVFSTDDRNSQGDAQECGGTNPINLATGNKFHIETLYQGNGLFPLQWGLTYNSNVPLDVRGMPGQPQDNSLAPGWQHHYQRQLLLVKVSLEPDARTEFISISRPDGQLLAFQQLQGVWQTDPDRHASLSAQADGGWLLKVGDDEESYDANGKLRQIRNRIGLVQTLEYDAVTGRLSGVRDPAGRSLQFAYDAAGRLQSVTTPGQQVFTLDQTQGKLVSITYPSVDVQNPSRKSFLYEDSRFPYALTGLIDQQQIRFASWEYDERGRAISSEHAGGIEKMRVAYNVFGHPTVTDSLQNARSYAFQTVANKRKLTTQEQGPGAGCNASAASLSYYDNGLVRSKYEVDGRFTNYEYEPVRQLETLRREDGSSVPRIISSEWHPRFRLLKRRAEPKRITTYEYDAKGNLLSQSEQATSDNIGLQRFAAPAVGAPRIWTYTYNSMGKIKTATGPRQDKPDVTTYEYDAQHNLSSIKNSAGHLTQFLDYNADGDVGRIIDANNLVTILRYTPQRQIESVEVSDGKSSQRTSYEYDLIGQLKQVTQPDGSRISYDYDEARRLKKIRDSKDSAIIYSYDSTSQLRSEEVRDAAGFLLQSSQRDYDGLKRLKQLTQGIIAASQAGQGYSENYEYDAASRLTKITNALQEVTDFAYDKLGRLQETTLPAASKQQSRKSISYEMDGRDQISYIKDPRYLATSYEINGLGNPKSQTSPDTGTESTQTDAAGNVISRVDARNISTSYSYDSLSRLTSIKWPNMQIQFAYDSSSNAKGRLSKVTDPSGQTQWQYNMFGMVVQKDQFINSPPSTSKQLLRQTMQYGSSGTANGKLERFSYPSGLAIRYSYAQDGKLLGLSLEDKNGSKLATILSNIGHRPFGAVQSWNWGNHSATANNSYARGIDPAGRISSYPLGNALAGGVQRTLVYDNANRITGFKHSSAANAALHDQTFGYDGQGRLTSATSASTNLGYQYDDNGNRTVLQIGGNSYSNAIDPKSNRLMNTNGPAPAKTNKYDKAGNLLSDGSITFTYDETNRMQRADRGSVVATYQYNGLGQRVLKQTTPAATGREKIFNAYDEAGHVIGEYDAQGSAITETVYLGDMPVAVIKPNPATPNKPAVFYIYADHLNTPRVITSAQDNKIVWRWTELGPFGEKLPEENPSGLGTFVYNLRFPGQVYDAESGLHQNYFRDFDPVTGRYVQSDPIGLEGQQVSTYNYVSNNPISYVDPRGLSPKDVQQIIQTFQETVGQMTKDGLRNPNRTINNTCRSAPWLPGCQNPNKYKDCNGQTDYMNKTLEQGRYEDTWYFRDRAGIGHVWGVAISSNPNDPPIWYDTRANEIVTGTKPCPSCAGWPFSQGWFDNSRDAGLPPEYPQILKK